MHTSACACYLKWDSLMKMERCDMPLSCYLVTNQPIQAKFHAPIQIYINKKTWPRFAPAWCTFSMMSALPRQLQQELALRELTLTEICICKCLRHDIAEGLGALRLQLNQKYYTNILGFLVFPCVWNSFIQKAQSRKSPPNQKNLWGLNLNPSLLYPVNPHLTICTTTDSLPAMGVILQKIIISFEVYRPLLHCRCTLFSAFLTLIVPKENKHKPVITSES